MDNPITTAAYAALPQEIRDLITDPGTFEKIEATAGKYGLNSVETGLLAQITGTLLTGAIRPNEFVPTIADYLNMAQENAALIAQELNRDIFNDVKDALRQLHGGSPAAASVPTPYPAAGVASLSSLPPARIEMPEAGKHVLPEVVPVASALPQAKPVTPFPPPFVPKPVMSTTTEPAQTPPLAAVQQPPKLPTPEVPAVPKIVLPTPPVAVPTPPAAAPAAVNNLEAKLGGTFTIKKDVMYTQPGTPAPITPMSLSPEASPPTAPNPVLPTPPPATFAAPPISDPYRELPS